MLPRSPGLFEVLLALVFSSLTSGLHAAADSVVVFNEIHYHPADEINDTEWIELRSLMGVDVDMSGWSLAGGVGFTFPEGTIIPGHGLLLVAKDPANAALAGKGALGPFTGQLDNGGETIRLENNSGRVMDELDYSDEGSWPVGADGSGATLTKLDERSADARPANWVASSDLGGTPGVANFPDPGAAPTVTQLLSLDATWNYRDTASAPPADWATSVFDDSGWPDGPGVLYAGSSAPTGAGEGMIGYWPLDESSGSSAPNSVAGGQDAQLFNGAAWQTDATRGQVLSFDGNNAYADAGSIPQQTTSTDFTWSFWANTSQGGNNNVIFGNRYSPGGGDFSPREFIKFTTNQFEFHRGGSGENIDYAAIPTGTWVHHAVVKEGTSLTYYRDGVVGGSRSITQGLNNAQPLYFGGDKTNENWGGLLDDPAVWERALPASSIAGLASGTLTPLTAPTIDNGSSGLLQTELTLGSNAFYFRHEFAFGGNPARTSLTLQLLVDDGAVVYLNGVEVHRQNMPAGAIAHGTLASSVVGDPTLGAGITIPSGSLIQGTNVLAVEVHQAAAADPDMAFGATLVSTELPPLPAGSAPPIAFSEIAAATDPSFQIELSNLSGSGVDLDGFVIQSSTGASYNLPAGVLASGAQLAISAATLGLTPTSGDRLFLLRPGGAELADAREVTNRLRGLSGDQWLYPTAPSFGAPNTFAFNDDIVISEIMYNPRPMQSPYAKSDEQWIELYNRGAGPVDLTGWEFSDGISFSFPAATVLNAGEYLIVARDAAALSAKLPGVTVLGDWGGSLSRGGERLILRDANKNIADELRYVDGGRWDERADGGGASLELIDPDADNASAESWAASDEGSRSSWQTYTYTASGTNHGNDPTQYNEFIFGLLDNGEILIDDISVVEDPGGAARQLIQNGDFSGGTSAFWRLLGTHRHTEVIDDPESPGNKVLHISTSGSTEHMHNHAETTLKFGGSFVSINGGLDYQISFRAKWLSGSNQMHTRLYFNRAARTTLLDVPMDGGTPGAANSRSLANAGPSFEGLSHSPAVPDAGEACVVSVSAADPDSVSGITLFYSVNGGAFASTAMADQGSGQWAGTIPGQAGSAKIQFYLQATDGLGATAMFPAAGPDSRAIIPVEDGQANLDYGSCQANNLRIVMTNADRDFMHTVTEVMSNDRLGCTVIWNESEIYYGCGVRLKGSQRGRAKDVRVGFNLRFPADSPFLGAHETIAVDRSGAGDQFSQKEMMVKHAINHAGGGIPGMEDDLIRVIAPKTQHTGSAMLLKSRYDSEWLDNMYDSGADGTAWEYELIYFPTSTTGGVEGLKRPNPDSVRGVGVTGLGSDAELYRWHWLIKNNRDEDDYAPLMEMLQAYGQSSGAPTYHDDMRRLLDVDQWLRAFAVQVLFGIGDNYSSGSQHNAIFYRRPEDGKFLFFPWDMDFTFNRGATSSLTPNGDLNKLLTNPANQRAYWGHIEDIVSTTYNTSYMTYWANHYSCFLPTESLTGFLGYIGTRSAHALSGVNSAIPQVAFNATTPDSSTGGTSIDIEGDGWVDVRELRLAGNPSPLEVTWIDNNSWRVTVPVAPGANAYVIEAYDFGGALIGTDTVNITGTGGVLPAAAGNLVISEVMYNPTAGVGEDADDYEYVELLNIHPTASVDLTGVEFVDGITFAFPSMTVAPGARVLVVRDLAAFNARYGAGADIAGEYKAPDGSNKLSNGGETVELVDALDVSIARFDYDDDSPWPTSADGDGYSLELINPTEATTDPTDPIHWRSSRGINGTPGGADAATLAGWAAANGIVDLTLDPDRDGNDHLAEFAYRTDPFVPDSPAAGVAFQGGVLVLQIVVRNGGDGILFGGMRSTDLVNWAGATYLGRVNNGDGETSTLSFGGMDPAPAAREFLRFESSDLP